MGQDIFAMFSLFQSTTVGWDRKPDCVIKWWPTCRKLSKTIIAVMTGRGRRSNPTPGHHSSILESEREGLKQDRHDDGEGVNVILLLLVYVERRAELLVLVHDEKRASRPPPRWEDSEERRAARPILVGIFGHAPLSPVWGRSRARALLCYTCHMDSSYYS